MDAHIKDIIEISLHPYIQRIEEQQKEIQRLKEENGALQKRVLFVTQSDDVKEFASALAKAQGQYNTAVHNQTNTFYKQGYANMSSHIKATRQALKENGFSVTQDVVQESNGQLYLVTTVRHSSGQWSRARVSIPEQPTQKNIQEFGKMLTYLQRYSYRSSLAIGSDKDDDGESTMKRNGFRPNTPPEDALSKEQADALLNLVDDNKDLNEAICEEFNVTSLQELKKNDFSDTIAFIDEYTAHHDQKEESNAAGS